MSLGRHPRGNEPMARAARLRMFRLAGADGWWPLGTVAAADLRTSMSDARVALALALGESPDMDGYITRREGPR